jgi:hypothetical protein
MTEAKLAPNLPGRMADHTSRYRSGGVNGKQRRNADRARRSPMRALSLRAELLVRRPPVLRVGVDVAR